MRLFPDVENDQRISKVRLNAGQAQFQPYTFVGLLAPSGVFKSTGYRRNLRHEVRLIERRKMLFCLGNHSAEIKRPGQRVIGSQGCRSYELARRGE